MIRNILQGIDDAKRIVNNQVKEDVIQKVIDRLKEEQIKGNNYETDPITKMIEEM